MGSTWNQPQWGGDSQPGTVDLQPPFPELYIRNYLNDLGDIPNESTPLKFTIDSFTVQAGQIQFTLTNMPSTLYSPIIYWQGSAEFPTVNYTINARTVSFPENVLNTGDTIKVRYAY